jgi:hypothetical protein
MILDRIMAMAAITAVAAFLFTLVGFVPDIDLGIVVVLAVALAAYDFWRDLSRDK